MPGFKMSVFCITCFVIIMITTSTVLAEIDVAEQIKYSKLNPAPSLRLENIAHDRQLVRESYQFLTGLLGGTLFIAGTFAPDPLTKGALQIAGITNIFSSYVLGNYKTAEERSWQKVQQMNTSAPLYKEKFAAEEILLNAKKSKATTLEGPHGLSVLSTGLIGSYLFFSGNSLGAFTYVGTYACFPKNTQVETQAALLKEDLRFADINYPRTKMTSIY
ncbi:hypothetical protein ACFL5G_00520 [Candidatus Margulisiibacteriota bacterium]